MTDSRPARLQYVCLGVIFVFLVIYQAGPAWDHFMQRFNAFQNPVDRTLDTLLNFITPVFSMALGLFVAAIRPRDRRAWLLIAFLLGFGEAARNGPDFSTRTDWLRVPSVLYQDVGDNTWSISMLLFMVYFPDRLPLDRRHPWLKWLLVAPILAFSVAVAFRRLGEPWAHVFLGESRIAITIAYYAVLICLFTLLGVRYAKAVDADERRRLRLLCWGTLLSLGPITVLSTIGAAVGVRDLKFAPVPILIGSLALVSFFPLTLAYVIVVQRALDVRVVVRQGLQYALAKNGVLVLQVLGSAAVILTSVRFAEDPTTNRPQRIAFMAGGIAFVFLIRRIAEGLRGWIDRRFFREAWRAEQVLSELAQDVRTMVETAPLLETVARRISESLHVTRIAMLVRGTTSFRPAYALGYGAAPVLDIPDDAPSVVALGRSSRSLRIGVGDDGFEHLQPEILLPLSSRDKLLGVISLGVKQSEEPYSPSDLQLLETVASQVGLALENSLLAEALAVGTAQRERMHREIEIAREVQERLFPQSPPAVRGLDCAGACRPALGVGGDYYDFLALPSGHLGIAIGDVSGKGVPAALLMASLQASLRGQTIHSGCDLAGLMGHVNRLIYDATPTNRYATFFYAQYDPGDRTLTWVNAGHNPPMLARGAEMIRLEDGGPAIGLLRGAAYSQASIKLQPGDVLVAFTDGISEAMNSADEEWGEDCLAEAIRACAPGLTAAAMIDRLIECADAFAAGAPQHDDMTLVVLRVVA